MTTATTPDPMTLEQIAAACTTTFYGAPVAFLGEDQEGVGAFTTDRRRALAAMQALVRKDLYEPFADLYDPTSLQSKWVLAYDTCGCNHLDPHSCRGDLNGPVTCCKVDPQDPDAEDIESHDCPHYGLPPCIEDLYGFVTDHVSEGTPGALLFWTVHQ